ncbi:oxidoreductase [Chitinophaga sp. Mgbs1]|uniref:Oxidoreductase n=1 Tax=Chitinophaga solisilvae TaxID=1233460 RepID=A0A9Q5D4H2_9BACT|nr:oxidoreductase [Chitinophaga solisilvae]
MLRSAVTIIFLLASGYFSRIQAQAQPADYHIKITEATPPARSIRGLSAVTDDIVWVSGTGGQVGRSTDGGRSWQWTRVSGCDSCDWRSLYAFDEKKAVVINAGEPAHIFMTADGGSTWQRVYFNNTPGIFFDAVEFFDTQEGIAIGDPLQEQFTVLRTHDGGRTWQPDTNAPAAGKGESIFAASGTSLITIGGNRVYAATGGTVSRLHQYGDNTWKALPIPLIQGQATTGTFSIAFLNSRKGIAVGGDYKNDTLRQGNCALTSDGGRHWTLPRTAPGGFKSCVAYITPELLITTGTSGTDISENGGKDWRKIGDGFHVARRARNGSRVFLAGKTIAILEMPAHKKGAPGKAHR